MNNKIYQMIFSDVYELYLNKITRKNGNTNNVDDVICWLTGYSQLELKKQIDCKVTIEEFFNSAPHLHPNRKLITGRICGVKVEEITDSLMQNIRYLDKLIDELASGKSLEFILRK